MKNIDKNKNLKSWKRWKLLLITLRLLSLSEITPMIFDMGVTHLASEAPRYEVANDEAF